MSYILDALKRADAERGRGTVPDLHAQPMPGRLHDDEAPGGARPWLWLGAGATIALLAVLAWQFAGRDAPLDVAVAPGPAVAASPAAAPMSLAESPMPPPTTAPVPAPAPAPVPSAPSERQSARTPVHAPTRPEPAETKRRPAPTRPVAKKAAPAPPTAPLLIELPDDVRRAVPAMVIGGSVYSPQPASRMLIVNGQVFREGSTLAADLQLEQIGPKSAIFSLKGQRFEAPY